MHPCSLILIRLMGKRTMITLCKAIKEDIPHLLPLMAQLGYPTTLQELEERFQTFINFDGYGVVVATMDDKLVGLVAWSSSKTFVLDKTRIHIEGLIVDKCYRSRGIGKQLMLHVEEIAKQLSPVILDLTSGVRRAKDGSHDFYKTLGYGNDGAMAKLYLRKEM